MSFATDTYTLLAGNGPIAAKVGTRISPYARNPNDDFPAIVFQIAREEIETDAGGRDLMRIATVEITCMDRTYLEADALAELVVTAIRGRTAARSLTIDRDYGDPYDGSSELVYRATVTATLAGS